MKKSIVFAFAVLFLGCDPSTGTKPSVVDEMITAFESGCSTGDWSRVALERSARLTGIFRSLNDKASCRDPKTDSVNGNLEQALSGSAALQNALDEALAREGYYRGERVAEENTNDLFLILDDPNLTPGLRDQLLSLYANERYQLSYNRTQLNYVDHASYASRSTSGLVRFSGYASSVLSSTAQLSGCLTDNPAKAFDIAANVGLIAGSFATPMVGLAVAAVSELLKVGVQAATSIPSARQLYKSRKDRMPLALSCGLEALTRDYCRARDSHILVDLAHRNQSDGEPIPFFYGIELADRDLPVLYRWLDQVVGGSNSANRQQSDNSNYQFSRLNRVLQMKRNCEGILNELERDLKNPKFTPEDRVRKVKDGLADIMLGALYMDQGNGIPYPYSDGPFKNDSAYVIVSQIAGLPVPEKVEPGTSIREFIGNFKLAYSTELVSGINDRVGSLLRERHQGVLNEFLEKVNLNPPGIVREASSETAGGLSAVLALDRLDHFFDIFAFSPPPYREQDETLINQVRTDLRAVNSDLKRMDATQMDRAVKILNEVHTKFKLENTNVFLPAHLQMLIRNDLTTRYRRGEGPKSVEDILLMAGRDVDLLLQKSKLGPEEVRSDLDRAQALTGTTLSRFRDFFSDSLAKAMEDLKESADRNLEPPVAVGSRSPNRHTLSRLCIMTLISGMEWPKAVDVSICRGAKIFSPDAKLELSFDALQKSLEKKSLDDRLCIHQDFLRIDRLASQNLSAPGGHDIGRRGLFEAAESTRWQELLDQKVAGF